MLMKRLLPFCFIILFILSDASAKEINRAVAKSVVLLFDLSYSMRLYDTHLSQARIDGAKKAAASVLSRAARNEEWALLTFSDRDEINVLFPFTRRVPDILPVISSLSSQDTSALDKALQEAGRYIIEEGKGDQREIILISDCVVTEGEYPSPDLLIKRGIRLNIIGFKLETNPFWEAAARVLARATGGDFFPINRDDKSFLYQNDDEHSGESYSSKLNTLLVIEGFLLLLLTLIAVYSLYRFKLWRRARAGAAKAEEYVKFLSLCILDPRGGKKIHRFSSFPVLITRGKGGELSIKQAAEPIRPGALQGFTIDLDNQNARLKLIKPLLVNGVMRSEKKLKPGDRINLSGYRLVVEGFFSERLKQPEIKKPDLILQGTAFVFLAVMALILPAIFVPAGEAAAASKAASEAAAEKNGSASLEASLKSEDLGGRVPAQGGYDPAAAIGMALGRAGALESTESLEIVEPGQRPEFYQADLLFIHAHPDDESLDFGGLMAMAAARGKRIVEVLFTDGESGLDQYPRRIVGGIYPAGDLSGSELAGMRVKEAAAALQIMGAETYIRLGLPNHPYSSVAEELSITRVIESWGGEERVVSRLLELIRGYRPKIIISPDAPSRAREHFEHEAVGYLTKKALAALKLAGDKFVMGHLVSVDPLQRGLYPAAFKLEVMGHGVYFRFQQLKALKVHETQRDASVIGVEVRANFKDEYYNPEFWDSGMTLDEYLSK
ncbi:1D-myo-inositol 2-acetamido-2-deoxy-alpha-D-glucopyranoside deacetylase [subsurface metagenome]